MRLEDDEFGDIIEGQDESPGEFVEIRELSQWVVEDGLPGQVTTAVSFTTYPYHQRKKWMNLERIVNSLLN